ncbi:hypothetical protein PQX77_003655, partial [Marasmius sp. AFHP31]
MSREGIDEALNVYESVQVARQQGVTSQLEAISKAAARVSVATVHLNGSLLRLGEQQNHLTQHLESTTKKLASFSPLSGVIRKNIHSSIRKAGSSTAKMNMLASNILGLRTWVQEEPDVLRVLIEGMDPRSIDEAELGSLTGPSLAPTPQKVLKLSQDAIRAYRMGNNLATTLYTQIENLEEPAEFHRHVFDPTKDLTIQISLLQMKFPRDYAFQSCVRHDVDPLKPAHTLSSTPTTHTARNVSLQAEGSSECPLKRTMDQIFHAIDNFKEEGEQSQEKVEMILLDTKSLQERWDVVQGNLDLRIEDVAESMMQRLDALNEIAPKDQPIDGSFPVSLLMKMIFVSRQADMALRRAVQLCAQQTPQQRGFEDNSLVTELNEIDLELCAHSISLNGSSGPSWQIAIDLQAQKNASTILDLHSNLSKLNSMVATTEISVPHNPKPETISNSSAPSISVSAETSGLLSGMGAYTLPLLEGFQRSTLETMQEQVEDIPCHQALAAELDKPNSDCETGENESVNNLVSIPMEHQWSVLPFHDIDFMDDLYQEHKEQSKK